MIFNICETIYSYLSQEKKKKCAIFVPKAQNDYKFVSKIILTFKDYVKFYTYSMSTSYFALYI